MKAEKEEVTLLQRQTGSDRSMRVENSSAGDQSLFICAVWDYKRYIKDGWSQMEQQYVND